LLVVWECPTELHMQRAICYYPISQSLILQHISNPHIPSHHHHPALGMAVRVCILDLSVTKVQTIPTVVNISVLSGYLRRIRTCSRLVCQIDSSMWVVQESAEVRGHPGRIPMSSRTLCVGTYLSWKSTQRRSKRSDYVWGR
jgi:hypothetical protein